MAKIAQNCAEKLPTAIALTLTAMNMSLTDINRVVDKILVKKFGGIGEKL
jgi:hypothetical protein